MAEDPLDILTQTVRTLIQRGRAQGYILRSEFDAAFMDLAGATDIEVDPLLIEDIAVVLRELGVKIVEEP